LGGSFYDIKEKAYALLVASKDIGLEANAGKSVISFIETSMQKKSTT
jgi:hypothetical protein